MIVSLESLYVYGIKGATGIEDRLQDGVPEAIAGLGLKSSVGIDW